MGLTVKGVVLTVDGKILGCLMLLCFVLFCFVLFVCLFVCLFVMNEGISYWFKFHFKFKSLLIVNPIGTLIIH